MENVAFAGMESFNQLLNHAIIHLTLNALTVKSAGTTSFNQERNAMEFRMYFLTTATLHVS